MAVEWGDFMAWLVAELGRERYAVALNEWIRVEPGKVLVVATVAALVLDGVLQLDGVLRGGDV